MFSSILVGLAIAGSTGGLSPNWQSGAPAAQIQVDKKHQADIDSDKAMGKKYVEIAEKDLKLSKDEAMLARVKTIGDKIAAIANVTQVKALWGDKRLSPFDYTFKLVEDKDVNAFSLPGGYVYVNTGLVTYCESDDELAGVLAHEIAHAALRHVATLQHEQEKLSSIQLPLILLAIFTGAAQEGLTVANLWGAAKGSGWSVQAEQAADYGGFQFLLKSDYNPTGMLTVMERLAKDERSAPAIDWGIFRTHPPGRERAESLMKYMKENNVPIQRSAVATSFRATVKHTDAGEQILFSNRPILTMGGKDAASRAEQAVKRLNAFFDSMPELYDVSAGTAGAIKGRTETLLTITDQDAAAQKKDLKAIQTETLGNLRSAVFNLAYKVWEA
jgi:predicted Zn-dependent protease